MSAPGFVYAIESGDAVKIGWSNNPRRRVHNLTTGSPVQHRLIGFIEATKDREFELHAQLSIHRIRGEWFRKEGLVIEFIKSLPPVPKPQRKPDKRTEGRVPVVYELRRPAFGPIRQKFADDLQVIAASFLRAVADPEERRRATYVADAPNGQLKVKDGSLAMISSYQASLHFFSLRWPVGVDWPSEIARPQEIDHKLVRSVERLYASAKVWAAEKQARDEARLHKSAGICTGLFA